MSFLHFYVLIDILCFFDCSSFNWEKTSDRIKWRCSESLCIRMACSLTSQMCFCQQRVFVQYHLSLSLISSEKMSLFSSFEFLLTQYWTYNLIMEWSYEDVVRWPFGNRNIDDIIAARLRGKFWSVRRREILSPFFTWCHLRRRCASVFLWYSWSLSID